MTRSIDRDIFLTFPSTKELVKNTALSAVLFHFYSSMFGNVVGDDPFSSMYYIQPRPASRHGRRGDHMVSALATCVPCEYRENTYYPWDIQRYATRTRCITYMSQFKCPPQASTFQTERRD